MRSLRQSAHAYFEYDEVRPAEWMTIFYRPQSWASVVLTVGPGQSAGIIVRSTRGRNLFALRGIELVQNAEAIVEAFEWTVLQAHSLRAEPPERELRNKLIERWRRVALRIARDD